MLAISLRGRSGELVRKQKRDASRLSNLWGKDDPPASS
jgi:hypothetical protein